ncbi:hypothetical protein HYZ78_01465 [Candidatus Microgenomates bacterium]|nr:hypothetical protein [Candidatus Microgenomates bacterium]
MPTNNRKPTKEELAKTKILREYGIKDLEKYIKKIKENIKVFEEAIGKEKAEEKRIGEMIKALKHDIKTIKVLQKIQK